MYVINVANRSLRLFVLGLLKTEHFISFQPNIFQIFPVMALTNGALYKFIICNIEI